MGNSGLTQSSFVTTHSDGFNRMTSGKDRGGYYHELFLRDRLFLCDRMMRTRIKGTGTKASMNPDSEPNFYQMPFVQPLSQTPRKPPTQTTWKMTFEQKPQEKKAIKRAIKQRCVSIGDDVGPLDIVSGDFEPLAVAVDAVVEGAQPPLLSRPASYPKILPLCMPVLPALEQPTSMTVTPPQTPTLEADLPPPPPEMPGDWLLADSILQDEMLFFEGKTFHYLDACSFDCLQEDRGYDPAWGFSMKDSDEFFAGM